MKAQLKLEYEMCIIAGKMSNMKKIRKRNYIWTIIISNYKQQ